MAQSECNCQLIYEVLEETEPFKFWKNRRFGTFGPTFFKILFLHVQELRFQSKALNVCTQFNTFSKQTGTLFDVNEYLFPFLDSLSRSPWSLFVSFDGWIDDLIWFFGPLIPHTASLSLSFPSILDGFQLPWSSSTLAMHARTCVKREPRKCLRGVRRNWNTHE